MMHKALIGLDGWILSFDDVLYSTLEPNSLPVDSKRVPAHD